MFGIFAIGSPMHTLIINQKNYNIQKSQNYTFENVILCDQVSLSNLSHNIKIESSTNVSQTHASDIWGYTSESGNEYAVISLTGSIAFVNITDPFHSHIVSSKQIAESDWYDIKSYKTFVYVSSEASSYWGVYVFNVTDIDNGYVHDITPSGLDNQKRAHNLINNQNYMYRVGTQINDQKANGFYIYELETNPLMNDSHAILYKIPEIEGRRGDDGDEYVHDAHIITYKSNHPYAYQTIAYACLETSFGVFNMTNKSDIHVLSKVIYPGISYAHQVWTKWPYAYLNDEMLIENRNSMQTTVFVFDVSNLSNVLFIRSFTNGIGASTHNLFIRRNFIYQANYASGVRVYEMVDPENPEEVAFFDTHPQHDNGEFVGLWGVYPFFESDVFVGSDIENGLFVWKLNFSSNLLNASKMDTNETSTNETSTNETSTNETSTNETSTKNNDQNVFIFSICIISSVLFIICIVFVYVKTISPKNKLRVNPHIQRRIETHTQLHKKNKVLDIHNTHVNTRSRADVRRGI